MSNKIGMPREALLEEPRVLWTHIDGPLLTWAGQLHWLTFRERIALWCKITTIEAIACKRWPARRSWKKAAESSGVGLCAVALVAAGLLAASSPARAQGVSGVFAGGQKFVIVTAASTNCQTIGIPGPHQILEITAQNTAATAMFLHLYDSAAVPTAGALTGQIGVYVLAAGASGTGLPVDLGPLGASVVNGIGLCITGGMPLADASAGAVGGVVNFTIK